MILQMYFNVSFDLPSLKLSTSERVKNKETLLQICKYTIVSTASDTQPRSKFSIVYHHIQCAITH